MAALAVDEITPRDSGCRRQDLAADVVQAVSLSQEPRSQVIDTAVQLDERTPRCLAVINLGSEPERRESSTRPSSAGLSCASAIAA